MGAVHSIKMLSLAARSREYGVVLVGDHPSLRADLPALLASSCGSETIESIGKLVDELITFKVASVDECGRVFNRRMVAEAELSAVRAAAGRAGAEATKQKRQTSGKGGGKRGGKASGNAGGKTRRSAPRQNGGQQRPISTAPDDQVRQNTGNLSGKPAASSLFTLSSVSKDTGAGAPIDPSKVTFGACVAYLIESGRTEQAARSILGMWRRDHGDDAVHRAVSQARTAAVSNPVSYIEACLRRASGASSTPGRRTSAFEAQP